MVAITPALKVGYFDSAQFLLRKLASLAVKPNYLSHMSAASFNSIDPEMATNLHRACGDHYKFFVAKHHGVDMLFFRLDSRDCLVVPKLCS